MANSFMTTNKDRNKRNDRVNTSVAVPCLAQLYIH